MNTKRTSQTGMPVFIFLHIPKTGGITFSEIVIRNFSSDRIFHIRNPKVPKAPRFSPNYGSYDDFAALSSAERKSFDCLVGHLRFGVHELIERPCVYATLLRDPVERVLSQHGQFTKMVRGGEFPGQEAVDLERYSEIRSASVVNQQARFLVGSQFATLDDEKLVRKAHENLQRHFIAVGTLERFDETLLVVNHRMGWRTRTYEIRNVGECRFKVTDLPDDDLERIRSRTRLDQTVFEMANRMLDDAVREVPGFRRKLARFRKMNDDARRSILRRSGLPALARRLKALGVSLIRAQTGRTAKG